MCLVISRMSKPRQCVSPIVQHPLNADVIVWASGAELLAYNVVSRDILFRLSAHTAPILTISFTLDDGRVLWVTAGEDKKVMIHREHDMSLQFEYLHRKKITYATIDNGQLLFCDMFGEAMSIDYKLNKDIGVLFGHFSVITATTKNNRLLITGDKDAKIRVCRYPDTFEIESFCLGHTSYVSHLALLDNDKLFSASGDGTIKMWNALSGFLLNSVSVAVSAIACMHSVGSLAYFVTEDSPKLLRSVDENMSPVNVMEFSSEVQGVFVTNRFIIGVTRDTGNLEIHRKSEESWLTEIGNLPTRQARCLFYKHSHDDDESDASPVSKQRRI